MRAKIAVLVAALSAGPVWSWAAEGKGKAEGASIKAGYRSVGVPVAPARIAGIAAGDRVDMLVTFDAKMADGKPEAVTATILQNVSVLEVNNDVIHLLLNPNEAQYAVLSTNASRDIAFIKRAQGDEEMHPMEMASFRKLFK